MPRGCHGGGLATPRHPLRDRGTGLHASRSGGNVPLPHTLHPSSPRTPHAFTTPAGQRYARTGGPEMKPSQAISLFMIERGMPGFSLGQRLKDK